MNKAILQALLDYYHYFSPSNIFFCRQGSSSQPIWLDDVPCSSSLPCIGDCVSSCPVAHNCAHSEDITITCCKQLNKYYVNVC